MVFGIIFLIEDYKTIKDCKSSSLWIYVLIATIFSFIGLTSNKKKSEEDQDTTNQICTLLCMGLIEGSFAIWGGIELWQKSCDEVKQTDIWTFALVTFYLQVIFAGIFIILMPCSFLICSICDNTSNKN